jgi:hypothetical protein
MAHDPLSGTASWLTSGDDADVAEWMAAERHPDAVSGEDETVHEAAVQRILDLIDRIARLPATGIVGLAVKTYLCIRMASGGTIRDPAGIPDSEPGIEISTLGDVLRILPEAPQLVSMAHGAGDR